MKIEIQNINKKFKNTMVLQDINLTFYGGKIYGLKGRNGSGKSVLLKILCGFYTPTEGSVFYNGKSLKDSLIRIRALIEKPSFFPYLSGFENLQLLAKLEHLIDSQRILQVLKLVGLFDDKDKNFSKYSLGMKQKLGIAQAIMEPSDLLILDEPFNGIDVQSVQVLKKHIKELCDKDKIIIVTSHIEEDLDILCDEIIELENGKIIQ